MVAHLRRLAPALCTAYVLVTLGNFYIFQRMAWLLGFGNILASAIYAFSMSTLLLFSFLVRTSSGRGTRGLFIAVTTVYGVEFAALFALAVFEFLNLFMELDPLSSALAILIFVAVLSAISAANAQIFRVKRVRLPFAKRLRVVQLTDVHIGAVHGRRYLRRVVDTVNSLKPDMILITGDVVSGAVPPGSSKLEYFGKLESRTFMVPGNHEYYEGMDEIRAALPGNIEILRDQDMPMDGFTLFGLDYKGEQGMRGTRKTRRKFGEPVIAMAHIPQFLNLPRGSIILSGHYHAGQLFPFNFLWRFLVKHFKGIYRKRGVTLYVSPGTATWGPPMRFGSMNEITLLELGPEAR